MSLLLPAVSNMYANHDCSSEVRVVILGFIRMLRVISSILTRSPNLGGIVSVLKLYLPDTVTLTVLWYLVLFNTMQ